MRRLRVALIFAAVITASLNISHAIDAPTASNPVIYRKSPCSKDCDAQPISPEMEQAKTLYKEWAGSENPAKNLLQAQQIITLLQKELVKHPQSTEATLFLASTYYSMGDAEDALVQFDRLIMIMGADGSGPDKTLSPGPFLYKAKALSSLCRDEEAEKLIQGYWAFWDQSGMQAIYKALDHQVKARLHHQLKCYCVPKKDMAATKTQAEEGNASAEMKLGMMSAEGVCAPRDYGDARKWLEKAANKGNSDAQVALGMLYVEGDGMARDPSQAFKWFSKAADQNNAEAQNSLGVMYYHGDGVPQSYEEAEKWYKKAAANGHEGAKRTLEHNAQQKFPI